MVSDMEVKLISVQKWCYTSLRCSLIYPPSSDNNFSCKHAVYHGFAVLVGFFNRGNYFRHGVSVLCYFSYSGYCRKEKKKMTYQEKVKFLKRYKQIDKEIDQLLREKSEIFSLGTKITPTYSDMPKGTSESDKVQSTVEKLEEYERKINIKIDDWCEAKLDIEKAIHTVESDKFRLLLRYRSHKWLDF